MNNAEFLNNNFGTNYKAWMKCRWYYSSALAVWMVDFDGSVKKGWQNKILDGKILEHYVDDPNKQLEFHKDFSELYRVAVDKSQNYKILGVYKFDEKNSIKRTKRIWIKVADSLEAFLQSR